MVGSVFTICGQLELLQRNKVTWKKVSKNMTYSTCFKIAKDTLENPELSESRATKIIKKHERPYHVYLCQNISQEQMQQSMREQHEGNIEAYKAESSDCEKRQRRCWISMLMGYMCMMMEKWR